MTTLMVTNVATVAEHFWAVNSKVAEVSPADERSSVSLRLREASIYVPDTAPVTKPLRRWRRKQ